MVRSMDKKNGRCAVVLPQGALFHSGKEGAIRKELIRSDRVEAVIALASGVFYSTGVSACVLFLSNDKPADHQERICIIDGSKIFTAQRAQNVISEKNAQEMLSLYRSYEPVIEKCAIATLADIEREGYVLSANNYVERKREKVEPPTETRKHGDKKTLLRPPPANEGIRGEAPRSANEGRLCRWRVESPRKS